MGIEPMASFRSACRCSRPRKFLRGIARRSKASKARRPFPPRQATKLNPPIVVSERNKACAKMAIKQRIIRVERPAPSLDYLRLAIFPFLGIFHFVFIFQPPVSCSTRAAQVSNSVPCADPPRASPKRRHGGVEQGKPDARLFDRLGAPRRSFLPTKTTPFPVQSRKPRDRPSLDPAHLKGHP